MPVHGKMLFQPVWEEGSKRSCLDLHQQVLSPFWLICFFGVGAQVLPTSRVPREDLVVCTDLEPDFCRRSALRFSPLAGSQRRTKRSASRADGAPRTKSRISLSVNAESATCTCSLFFQNVIKGSSLSASPLIMLSFFHPLNHLPRS